MFLWTVTENTDDLYNPDNIMYYFLGERLVFDFLNVLVISLLDIKIEILIFNCIDIYMRNFMENLILKAETL